jgi:hypothetical protein
MIEEMSPIQTAFDSLICWIVGNFERNPKTSWSGVLLVATGCLPSVPLEQRLTRICGGMGLIFARDAKPPGDKPKAGT